MRTTLASIVRYNTRTDFTGFTHGYRTYADQDDAGLLICSWPHGGRPDVPIRYADEVWTGVEYQVAAHCMYEGLREEGLSIITALRARHDGRRRNPYNEIECGDHYSRAMAGWSILEAWTGAGYDAVTGTLAFGTAVDRYPLFAGNGWGIVHVLDGTIEIECLGGDIRADRVFIDGRPAAGHGVLVAGGRLVVKR